MAALPLCASWFPPSGVAVASQSARPASSSRVTHIHSLGRRGRSPLPIRIQARTRASHLRFPKAADRDHGPERGDDKPDAAASTEIPFSYDVPDILELRNFRKAFCDGWLPREAPDMFRIEKDEITNYMRTTLYSPHANVKDVNYKGLALFVCAEAKEALDLASMVMDLTYTEGSGRGKIQLFDQPTANQVIGMCTPVFCHVAKAAYLKRIETDTDVLSFLDALRGLGVFCDMLIQEIVFKLKDGPLKNSISIMMGTYSRKFDKKMKSLKEQFIRSTDAPGIKCKNTNQFEVMCTLSRGMRHTQSYILQMIPYWSLFA